MKIFRRFWNWLVNPWHGVVYPHLPDPWLDYKARKGEKEYTAMKELIGDEGGGRLSEPEDGPAPTGSESGGESG